MGSYVPNTDRERAIMLEKVGVSSMDELFAGVPGEVRSSPLRLPEGLSEMEVAAKVKAMAAKNTVFRSIFRGAGAYHHYIPSIVPSVTGKETFMTAYTPYQAEISQGVLQSIFEYQTMICELLGMDAANASVYDGASAAAEPREERSAGSHPAADSRVGSGIVFPVVIGLVLRSDSRGWRRGAAGTGRGRLRRSGRARRRRGR